MHLMLARSTTVRFVFKDTHRLELAVLLVRKAAWSAIPITYFLAYSVDLDTN
jgi:hypothetical protein